MTPYLASIATPNAIIIARELFIENSVATLATDATVALSITMTTEKSAVELFAPNS